MDQSRFSRPATRPLLRHDMRPDRVGWTVYDVTDGRTVSLGELPLVGLDQEDANELVDVLNRQDLAIDRAARRLVLDAMRPRVRG